MCLGAIFIIKFSTQVFQKIYKGKKINKLLFFEGTQEKFKQTSEKKRKIFLDSIFVARFPERNPFFFILKVLLIIL